MPQPPAPIATSSSNSSMSIPKTRVKIAWDANAGPSPGEYAKSFNGYQLPIAMEVRRGRFNKSLRTPRASHAQSPTLFPIPLRDRDHVFLKGHRIMVQVQSTWFPLIDRNPQKFTPSIYTATEADYVRATQRIYCSPNLPSHIQLPLMP